MFVLITFLTLMHRSCSIPRVCAFEVSNNYLNYSVFTYRPYTFYNVTQGVKLTFFSDSHLAPKFFKVVANSKKVGRHFQRQTKSFFTPSAF